MKRPFLVARAASLGLAVLYLSAPGAVGAGAPDGGFTDSDLKPHDANTPVYASRDAQDLQVTARIRGALEADDALSVFARNVRVSTNSDAVILRGTVGTNEVGAVEAVAQQYCGMRQIINELSVDERLASSPP